MKNSLVFFSAFLIFFSCSPKENSLSIEDQIELMKNDPISIEYFESTAASLKVLTEDGIDLDQFNSLVNSQNQKLCDIDKTIFKGDIQLENFSKIQCRLSSAAIAFKSKFSFINELTRDERMNLFKSLQVIPDFDMEKIRKNNKID